MRHIVRVPQQRIHDYLGDDRPKLPTGSGNAVHRGPVPCWERFAGHEKCCRVWAAVEKKASETVEEEEGALGAGGGSVGARLGEFLVGETWSSQEFYTLAPFSHTESRMGIYP